MKARYEYAIRYKMMLSWIPFTCLAMGLLALASMGISPGRAFACNAYTITFATPLSPLQAGVQRVAAVAVKSQTGLSIVIAQAVDSEQHLDRYIKAKSDLLVITGSEPKAFLDGAATLPGRRIEAKEAGIAFLIHPDTLKLFPKMADLLAKLTVKLEKAGRDRLSAVTTDAAAERILEGR